MSCSAIITNASETQGPNDPTVVSGAQQRLYQFRLQLNDGNSGRQNWATPGITLSQPENDGNRLMSRWLYNPLPLTCCGRFFEYRTAWRVERDNQRDIRLVSSFSGIGGRSGEESPHSISYTVFDWRNGDGTDPV
jgi:hypothetical protein